MVAPVRVGSRLDTLTASPFGPSPVLIPGRARPTFLFRLSGHVSRGGRSRRRLTGNPIQLEVMCVRFELPR